MTTLATNPFGMTAPATGIQKAKAIGTASQPVGRRVLNQNGCPDIREYTKIPTIAMIT